MRSLYVLLLRLLAPLLVLRLLVKARRQPEYGRRIGERFGYVADTRITRQKIAVWVHAVSVGETLAALPLIEALIRRHGEGAIWVTTMTPTGSERVTAALGNRVRHSYIPYDLPGAVSRFLDRVQPSRLIVMETELWPTLFRHCRQRQIPVIIANARLSRRSLRGYLRVAGLAASTLADCRVVAAQSKAHARRFLRLAAGRNSVSVSVMGNLKFDVTIPSDRLAAGKILRQVLGGDHPVWIAASTHDGEERIVLDAHIALLRLLPAARLILVPRHPHRFEEVASLALRSGLKTVLRSEIDMATAAPLDDVQVLIGDSMGEMFIYLAAGDVAFVGGSLVDVGGHNVLEPAALGLPVLFGPHMHNFSAARTLLLERGAAIEVGSGIRFASTVGRLLAEPDSRERMGRAGQQAVAANRGALDRLLALIDAVETTPAAASIRTLAPSKATAP